MTERDRRPESPDRRRVTEQEAKGGGRGGGSDASSFGYFRNSRSVPTKGVLGIPCPSVGMPACLLEPRGRALFGGVARMGVMGREMLSCEFDDNGSRPFFFFFL